MLRRLALAALLTSALACSSDAEQPGRGQISPIPSNLSAFDLSSPAFDDGAAIPAEFTCDGENISPPLRWSGVPEGTVELVLTFLDPDAPSGVFTHWTVFVIDPDAGEFPVGALPGGALQGENDFGDVGYGGPCPPEGMPHHYDFTLAALGQPSGLGAGAAPADVDAVLQVAIATTTLTGIYPG